jgi:hypothetical protein
MEKITLRLFWVCMVSCASLVVVGIWLGDDILPEAWFKLTATLFIVGLASFLFWSPLMAYRFLNYLSR